MLQLLLPLTGLVHGLWSAGAKNEHEHYQKGKKSFHGNPPPRIWKVTSKRAHSGKSVSFAAHLKFFTP
jgi:hypothetical protein